MIVRLSTLSRALLVLIIGTAAGMHAAGAQSMQTLARATVPFAFQYGSHTFPAGTYTFGMTADNIMAVRGPGNAALGLVSWGDMRVSEAGRLVFRRYGERIELQDVYVPRLAAHLHCPPAPKPKHFDVAASKPADTPVEVALLSSDH